MGVISQASSAFGHILDDLSIVINSFNDVSKFSAGIDRLFSFLRALQDLEHDRSLESLLTDPEGDVELASKSDPFATTSSVEVRDAIRVKAFDPELTSHLTSQTLPVSGERTPLVLSIKGLKLLTPDNKRLLVQNLDLSVVEGKNLLIVGASGSGKSSLLRAIAGLWSTGEGEIIRPNTDHVYFLPQKPYVSVCEYSDQCHLMSLRNLA